MKNANEVHVKFSINLHNNLIESSGAHLKVFGVEHFDTTHSADALLVGHCWQ